MNTVREEVTRRLWLELVRKGLGGKSDQLKPRECPSCHTLLDLAFRPESAAVTDVAITLKVPVVAVGAPVHQYFPQVVRKLGTELMIPKHWDVANAVGSAVGNVLQEVIAEVYRERMEQRGRDFVVQWPGGLSRADDEQEALALARAKVTDLATGMVEKAGGKDISVTVEKQEFRHGNYFHAKVKAVAVGKPRIFSEPALGPNGAASESYMPATAAT